MEKLKRYVIFLFGLFISSFGVSLVTKANLGTSPISAIPYVLSLNFSPTLGNFTIIFSVFLIFLQLLILRKNFKLEHILQIPISIAFGYFIDFTMILLSFVNPQLYVVKIIYLILGCIVLGFGVYLEVLADVAMLPGESFVRAVSTTWKTDFGITKICFDVSMTVGAVIISFVCAGRLDGVREGTIIAALLVGFIARLLGRMLAFAKPYILKESLEPVATTDMATSNAVTVIAIGRQYGCGGHNIGTKIAKKLGWNFYDKEIIQMTAGSTGYTPEFVQSKEENMTNSLLFDLVNQMYAYSNEHNAPKDKIFEAESKVINQLASENKCVITGRCSDYILRNNKNCFRIFLHAPIEYRIKNISKLLNISEKEAEIKIRKEDKRRADNYRYYTGSMWGNSANYNLSFDTSVGEDFTVELLSEIVNKKL